MTKVKFVIFKKEIVAVTRAGGEIVVSGQRVEDQEKVKPWLKEAGLHIVNEAERNGWWAFTAKLMTSNEIVNEK